MLVGGPGVDARHFDRHRVGDDVLHDAALGR
jgi:hypothetical protein